jgi:integrase
VLRPKTWEEHHVPLFPEVAAVIEAQLKEQRDRKLRKAVRREDQLVFTRPDDPMAQISLAMVSHWHLTVCAATKIADFRFQDFRHCAATRWARERSLTAQQWAKAMGWSLSGGGMQQTYINLKQGDVGAAFGLAGVPQT